MNTLNLWRSKKIRPSEAKTFARIARTLADMTGCPVTIQVSTPHGVYAYTQHPLEITAHG